MACYPTSSAKIGLIDLFRLPTIARIAAHIEGRQHEAAPAPTTGPINARDDIAIVGMAGRFPRANAGGILATVMRWRGVYYALLARGAGGIG